MQVGGKELVGKLSIWKKFGRRNIDDVVDDLAGVSLDVTKMAPEAQRGYKQLISELAAKGNKAKGAAHALRTLKHYQDKGYKIKNIEAQEVVTVGGTRLNHSRRYDMIIEVDGKDVRIECKSWNFDNVLSHTKKYLGVKGGIAKQTDEIAEEMADFEQEGAQLFADLLSFAQKGNAGHRWAFDDAMADGGKLFKDTIADALENYAPLKKEIMDILSKSEKKMTDVEFDDWVDKLVDKLDDFVEIIPAK